MFKDSHIPVVRERGPSGTSPMEGQQAEGILVRPVT